MWPKPAGHVHAVVCSQEWSQPVRRDVLASLHGQVSSVGVGIQPADGEPSVILIVTAPVVFARGAVRRLRRAAERPDRVVTRVLVPGEEPTAVALWSGAWLARRGIGLTELSEGGLDFDRDQLPHADPYVRAWVRADDVGLAQAAEHADVTRWARAQGVRLGVRRAVGAVRAVLGRLRRTRSLAKQRRRSAEPAQVR